MGKTNWLAVIMALCLLLSSCSTGLDETSVNTDSSNTLGQDVVPEIETTETDNTGSAEETVSSESPTEASQAPEELALKFSLTDIPPYSGKPFAIINSHRPFFAADEITDQAFESYAPLDELGRCGVAFACVGLELMPTEERGSIGMVKPTGWHTVRYDGVVSGNYLYNRCHLIGYQLTGENANLSNLITGTRYLNVEGMLPYEDLIAEYVEDSGNHVLYRVTPIFEGDNSLAAGVLMEGMSVEDNGDDVCFCIFAYNVQPDIGIDYATGDSWLIESKTTETTFEGTGEGPNISAKPTVDVTTGSDVKYIMNTNTKKFHVPSCSSVDDMKPSNKQNFCGTRDEAIAQGYKPCGRCNP